jgi:hypothetical protein
MNIIKTLGFAAVAAAMLGGVAMAQQSDGYSTPDPYAMQHPAATYYRAPVTNTQPQSGSSDVQPNRGTAMPDYGQIDSPG